MSMDLGNLKAGVEIDARNAEATLDRLQVGFQGLEESQKKVAKSNVDVAPKGQRQLDTAKMSADKLSVALGEAGNSARTITVPPGADRALGSAATSAGKLSNELNNASSQARELGGTQSSLGGLDSGLAKLAGTARGLVPALGAAAAAGSVFTKGWDRLTGIDNAQFKLQGLGHNAESVASIMNSAMESVSGTAYGFGDAASLAAGAVAATGAQGQRLTQILTTIADTSAIAGRGLGDIGMIFNQVAASGTLMGDDLAQLMDSGIPIITYLADEMGVAASEVKGLASEGAISFDIMESALRNQLGGAATEMGASVTGALSNVGAAAGRLGAELLSGPFSAAPGVLEDLTGGINSLTGGVKDLYAGFGDLPGPVKTFIGLMAGAKSISLLASTDIGKNLVGSLRDLRKNAAETGKVYKDAFSVGAAPMRAAAAGHREMAAAAKLAALQNKSAFGAADDMARQAVYTFRAAGNDMLGTAKGSMNAAFTGMKRGAAGVLDFFGGPWMIGLAAGAWAIGEMVDAHGRMKDAQTAITEAARESAGAHRDLQEAVAGANGAYEGTVKAAAEAAAAIELAPLTEHIKQMDGYISSVDNFREVTKDTGANVVQQTVIAYGIGHAYRQAGNELETALSGMGYKMEDLNAIVAEGGPAYQELIENLDRTSHGGKLAANQIEAAREEIERSVRIGSRVSQEYTTIGEGLDQLADQSANAATQLGGLRDALRAAGLIESTESEAAFELAEGIKAIADAAGAGIDDEKTLGWGLLGPDGLLNSDMSNAAELNGQLQDLRTEFEAATDSGMDAGKVWDEMHDTMGALAKAYKLPIEEIERLANAYGILPEEYDLYMSIQGGGEAAETLANIHLALRNVEEGTVVPVGVMDDGTADLLKDLGYDLEQLEDGDWAVTVNPETGEAQEALEDVLRALEGLDTERVSPSVGLDNAILSSTAQHSRELLEELDIMNPSPEADLIIDKLEAGKSISMRELGILGSETATPLADLDPSLFNDKLLLTNKQLDALNIKKTEPVVTAKDEATPVIEGIRGRLASLAGNVVMRIMGVENRAEGGPIPALAYGGTAGGYRLPLSGPGTGTVDGILGRDYATGEPTAWVNRGEYVTNDKSTRKYLRTLEAVNQDDPSAILRSLSAELPRLESGGQVSQRIKSSLASMNGTPYVFGGWSPAGVDCTGATSLAANLATNSPMWESRHATMNMGQWLEAKGAVRGKGDGDDLLFAYYNGGPGGGHAAARLPDGTYIESGGNTGQGLTIGGKAGPLEGRGFTDWYHFPYSANGEDGELTGDGGTTVGGLGSVKALKRTGGGGSPRAGAAGGAYNVPGLASNTPGGATIGQSIGGQASAAITGAVGSGAAGVLNATNPFVGNRTWAENLGPQLTQQVSTLASEHGFGAEVMAALEGAAPNWDVWLRVNDETIAAFNTLQEAKDSKKASAEEITRAEEELTETRKQLAALSSESGEMSVSNARKLEDAEESLRKAREGGKADSIATAEKKLARVREDIARDAAKGDEERAKKLATLTGNLETAELNLADAMVAAEQAAEEAAAAQQAYNLALQMAPLYAVVDLFKGMTDNMGRLAEAFDRMNSVMERTQELVVSQENAELAAVQGKIDLFNATEEVSQAERAQSRAKQEYRLEEQQAEWDLAMARHEAAQVVGTSEVDLAELRRDGIYDVMQVADQGNREAYLAASNVAVSEAVLADIRARGAAADFENTLALSAAQARLEYSQVMAEAQSDRLKVATEELAAAQGGAAGESMTAIAKETEGKAKRGGGLLGMVLGGLKVAGAVGLTVATGGTALPAALALGASGVADFGTGLSDNLTGKAQQKAYEEEARREYEALDPETRRKVDLARAGVPISTVLGAVVGAAGGSSDDVNNVVSGINDLTSAGLNAEIAGREGALGAAELRRNKQLAEIEARERQAELDYRNFQLGQLETNKDQRDYLAEIKDLTEQQLAEHQQENKQLADLNGRLADKDQSVLMSIGGSQWGSGEASGVIGMEPPAGFGGLTSANADMWSSLNVENGWMNTDRTRQVVPWAAGEQEYLDTLRNPYVEGLPDTVVLPQAAADTGLTVAEVRQIVEAAYAAAKNGDDTPDVGTQFTGPVTIQGREADDTIDELQRQLARG